MKTIFKKAAQIVSLFLAGFGTLSVGYSQPTFVTNGLAVYFPFNASVNDASGHGINGVLNGGGITFTNDRFGAPNAAAHFTGSSYLSLTPTPFNINADYSVSFWVKLDNAGNFANNFFSTGQDNYGGLNIRNVPNTPVAWDFSPDGPQGIVSLTPTNYYVWHAIACVHQGTNDLMYIDGELVASGGHSGTASDSGSLWIGRHQAEGFDYYLQGVIDDIRIYSRALTNTEVTQLYAFENTAPAQPTFVTNGLAVYFPFNASVNDASGHGINGVLNGGGITFTNDRFGAPNAAAHFTGSSYLSLTPTPFNINADYSVSFWVKLDNAGNFANNFFSTGQDNYGGLNIRNVPNTPVAWDFSPDGPQGIVSLTPTNYYVWHAIACVHQGTNDLMYIDGELVASGGHSGTASDSGSLWIGRHQAEGFDYYLQGVIDDIRIYSRALTNTEVTQLYAFENTAPAQPTFVTNGLAVYFPFNASVNDASGHGINGVLNGGGITFTNDRFGAPNAAAHFTGSSYLSLTPTPFNINADYSVSFWVKLDNAGNFANNFFSTGQDNYGGLNIRNVPNTPVAWDFSPDGPQGIVSLTPTNYYVWHAIACVHQGTNDLMYIDGELVASGGHSGTASDSGSLWIGRHQAEGFDYYLQGVIDDIRIYSRALTNTEVTQLYAFEKPIAPVTPVTPIAIVRIYPAIEIDWTSQTNYTYQVQYSTLVAPNTWINLGSPVAGTGSILSTFEPTHGQPKKFYRVQTLP